MQIGRVLGGLGTLWKAWDSVMDLKKNHDYTTGRALLLTTTGWDETQPEDDGLLEMASRAFDRCWWPAIAGEGAHQLIGNPQGAYGTGIGMKLNRHTPKGFNI